MTPKEKSEELIRKYYRWGLHKDGQSLSWLESKECALIAVDEILNVTIGLNDFTDDFEYWQQIKQEIKTL
jgi:hypothetical protein